MGSVFTVQGTTLFWEEVTQFRAVLRPVYSQAMATVFFSGDDVLWCSWRKGLPERWGRWEGYRVLTWSQAADLEY